MTQTASPQPATPDKMAKPWYKKWWGIAIIVVLALAIIGALMPKDDASKEATTEDSPTPTATAEATPSETPAEETAAAPTEEATAAPEPTEEAVPREYISALKSAETYLSFAGMSKQGLYDQLTSEYGDKFSAEAAQYAVDNINADWNEQALKSAKTYQEMNMSPAAIYDQLISEHGEKFTAEQAQWAIDNLPQ